MKELQVKGSDYHPEIISNQFEVTVTGRSMMEDAALFYAELMTWAKQMKVPVMAKFDLVYFNSSSSKQILRFLLILEEENPGSSVIWYYPKGNSILEKRGKEFEIMVDLKFEYIPKS